MDRGHTFSRYVEMQVNKANKIFDLVGRSYEYLEGDSLKKLFKSLVRPHLKFSNSAWSTRVRLVKDKKLLESVQCCVTKLVSEERLSRLKLAP